MANEIKTRILLKYDSYTNWEASEFILKKGEAAVCEMSNTVDESGNPTILVKYGNGNDKFADLPWTSALAADVYAWAKQSPEDFIKWVNENIEHPAAPVITTGTENGTIAVDGIDVAVAGLQDAAYATVASLNATAKGYADAVEAVVGDLDDIGGPGAEFTVDTTSVTSAIESLRRTLNEAYIKIGKNTELNGAPLQWYDNSTLLSAINSIVPVVGTLESRLGYEEPGFQNPGSNFESDDTIDTYYKAIMALDERLGKISTAIKGLTQSGGDFGPAADIAGAIYSIAYAVADLQTAMGDTIGGVTNGDTVIGINPPIDGKPAIVLNIDTSAPGNVELTKTENGLKANVNPGIFADYNKVEAMYTNDQIDGFIADAKKYADDNDANDNTEYHVEYDSENKKIKLVAGADASKMEIDATDFIKDGMIDTVTIGIDNDLIITFNTVSGKDDIILPLDQLVDIYTGVDGAKVKVSVSADKKISADIVAGSIAKTDLAADVQTSLGLADTALQEHQDISHLASKTDVVVALAEAEGYADDLNAAMNTRVTAVEDKLATVEGEVGAKAAAEAAAALAQGVKDTVDQNKETWDKAGTALQAADLNGYAKTTEVTEAIEGAIEGEVARADGAYAPKTATAQGIENANAAAEAAQGTANNAKSLAEAALPKATAETDYLKKTDAATTYRAKQDKIIPADLSEDVFIFDCGSAIKNID